MFALKLLGGASIRSPRGPVGGRAAQRRRLGLLALLATPRQRGASRERLVAYLWPDVDAERGRALLSDSVYRINQSLGGEAITTAGDELHLNSAIVSPDVGQLEEAVVRGDHRAVVSLYAGPFLDGVFLADSTDFEHWVDAARQRFARTYASSVEALAESAARAGDGGQAVEWWMRLAAHDPCNSRVAVRLMAALEATGARAAAIRHAESHTALFRRELGAEPDAAVGALAERLRGTRIAGAIDATRRTSYRLAMRELIYLDDIHVGQRFTSDSITVDESEIIAFAKMYDPQPFHTDPAAAQHTMFRGLIASGWHTAALTMRLFVTSGPPVAGGLIGAGAEIAWPTPTRAGDTLHVEGEVLTVTPSRSQPDRGVVTIRSETRNQRGQVAQIVTVKIIVPRRPVTPDTGS